MLLPPRPFVPREPMPGPGPSLPPMPPPPAPVPNTPRPLGDLVSFADGAGGGVEGAAAGGTVFAGSDFMASCALASSAGVPSVSPCAFASAGALLRSSPERHANIMLPTASAHTTPVTALGFRLICCLHVLESPPASDSRHARKVPRVPVRRSRVTLGREGHGRR